MTPLKLKLPVLLRKAQVLKMLHEHLQKPPSEWILRNFLEGKDKRYFLKPAAYYTLNVKINRLYHPIDVEDFIKWYNFTILNESIKKNEIQTEEVKENTES